MAVGIQGHPSSVSDLGSIADGGDCLSAIVNGSLLPGFIATINGGIRVSVNSSRQPHKANGSVQMIEASDPELSISIDGVYAASGNNTQRAMSEALGLYRNGWRWSFKPLDKWIFDVAPIPSDRGRFARGALRDIILKTLMVDDGSAYQIPGDGLWRLSLKFFYYPESNVNTAPLRIAREGNRTPGGFIGVQESAREE